jgi:uncharacterized protein YjiS (DUF1127 family)
LFQGPARGLSHACKEDDVKYLPFPEFVLDLASLSSTSCDLRRIDRSTREAPTEHSLEPLNRCEAFGGRRCEFCHTQVDATEVGVSRAVSRGSRRRTSVLVKLPLLSINSVVEWLRRRRERREMSMAADELSHSRDDMLSDIGVSRDDIINRRMPL